jgi:PPK2 family polyphosphate:nucleotide phosphotransferase
MSDPCSEAHSMKIDSNDFRPREGKAIHLDKWPTIVPPLFESQGEYEAVLKQHVEDLSARQQLHYASARYAVLLILQGLDAAGKDGTTQHVMSGVNPEGCEVFSFRSPSEEELKHDFLWRTTCRLPERGRIGIFNRSYYEEVLIVRVHPKILDAQNLPNDSRSDNRFWEHRFRSITDFEKHLHVNGTRIIKIFLHLSKSEQKTRFIARITDPQKKWKFSRADIHERQYWKALSSTNTVQSPWYIVPADEQFNSRLIVSKNSHGHS